jgi:hypothetical protein
LGTRRACLCRLLRRQPREPGQGSDLDCPPASGRQRGLPIDLTQFLGFEPDQMDRCAWSGESSPSPDEITAWLPLMVRGRSIRTRIVVHGPARPWDRVRSPYSSARGPRLDQGGMSGPPHACGGARLCRISAHASATRARSPGLPGACGSAVPMAQPTVGVHAEPLVEGTLRDRKRTSPSNA